MRVIYIAGPFRGKTPWEVERNVRRAEEIAFWVASQGAVPQCPHTMYRFFDKTLTDEFWLAASMELARRSDACILVPGWTGSVGSKGERAYFEQVEKPIFEKPEELVQWLAKVSPTPVAPPWAPPRRSTAPVPT
jgi:hypothetical protein